MNILKSGIIAIIVLGAILLHACERVSEGVGYQESIQEINFNPDDYEDPRARAIATALSDGPNIYSLVLNFYRAEPGIDENTMWKDRRQNWIFDESANKFDGSRKSRVYFPDIDYLLYQNGFTEISMGGEGRQKLVSFLRDDMGIHQYKTKLEKTYLKLEIPVFQVISFEPSSIDQDTQGHFANSCDGQVIRAKIRLNPASEIGNVVTNSLKINGVSKARFYGCAVKRDVEYIIHEYIIGEKPIHEYR